MKKIILIAAGLIAMSASVSFAQTNTPAGSPAAQPALHPSIQNNVQHPTSGGPAQFQAKRQEFFKNLGLNPEDLRTNTPAERQAKIKEAAAKKSEELSKKKAAGTLTPEEQQMLPRLEMMKNMTNRPVRAPQAPIAPKAPEATK